MFSHKMHCYQYIILSFASHLNYGLLLWATHVNRVSKLQKKTVRRVSNSEYLAHSEPLFKTLRVLKIDHLYKLKLMKFYYNWCYNLLPAYFKCYLSSHHRMTTETY